MSAIPLLRCLGQFHLEWHGQPIALATRKTAALLAYLVFHPEVHLRYRLVTLFWGDFGEAEARQSLRTALNALRKGLGADCLLADRETVQFNPHYAITVDAVVFRTQARHFLDQPLPEPTLVDVTLYQGDFLAGMEDEWILGTREALRLLYLQVLLRLTQHWRTQGDYPQAIAMAQQILILEPAEEAAHQLLIFSYMAMGDRQAAHRQYENCVRMLHEELDVEPAPDTVTLYRRSQQLLARASSSAAVQTNLPLPLSSFIGRSHEIAHLKALFVSKHTVAEHQPARLVTVTGPGGCGKTRLAIQVARELLELYGDGVWWIDLASLSEARQVPQAVATVFSVEQGVQPSLTTALVNHLRGQQLLLVLDNCEHLIANCATLVEHLLSGCPSLQILATSRETLAVGGEISWLAPSLTLPGSQPDPSPGELLQFEGIRLFVERASAAQRGFALTAANAPAVRQICQQLDGIPLAIELAAARIKLLTVEQLATRLAGTLDERFTLLATGGRTVRPRQQTLRATIEWSYVLLSEPEQCLLQQLSVFAGGWSLEAAEMVGEELRPATVSTLLARLVDKSLVLAEPQGEVMRYRMLETIRQYADEQLTKSAQAAKARNRHLTCFLQLAEQAAQHFRKADQAVWLARLADEHDNLRSALAWVLDSHQPERGARLGIALWRFWYIRGYYDDGWQWLVQLLTQVEQPQSRAQLLYGQGMLARRRADSATVAACFIESLALFRTLGDQQGIASTLRGLGFIYYFRGDYGEARPPLEEALALFRTLDDQEGIAVTLDNLAYITSDNLHGQQLFQESLAIRRHTGNLHGITTSLAGLAALAIDQGDYATARSYLQEHLQINQKLGNQDGVANAFAFLGKIALEEADYPTAQLFQEKSRQLAQKIGDRAHLASSLLGLGIIALKQGECAKAHPLFEQALMLYQTLGTRPAIASVLEQLADFALAQGQTQQALTLMGAANTLGPVFPGETPSCIQTTARHLLSEEVAATAWEAGQMMTPEQAVAYAFAKSIG